MPVTDLEKNRAYVAKHRAMQKANEDTKKQYNELNAGYIKKHRDMEKDKIGEDEYKKKQNEYMRKYRAQKKQEKQMETNKIDSIIKIQNAIRNKNAINKVATLYANRVTIPQKQMINANEVLSQINQEKELKNKLNASVIANDILNDIFPQVINNIPEKQPRVKLVATRIQPTEENVKRKPGRPKKPRNSVGRPKSKK